MADDVAESSPPDDARRNSRPALGAFATQLVAVGTLGVSILTAVLSARTQGLVERSTHAGEVTADFTQNVDKLTASFTKHAREDEEAADVTLTALQDFAQTADDQIVLVTIAARMLNPSACRSDGEATARFLTGFFGRLELERTADSRAVMAFVRSRPFLDLAASDVTDVYYNDDPIQEPPDACSDPQASPSTQAPAASGRTAAPLPPSLRNALQRARLRATPENGDPRNHASYWGEQTMWNDAKVALFRELRADDYAGWIHIGTWEEADACVDAGGKARVSKGLECGPAIAIDYTSVGIPRVVGDTSVIGKPFWLGRARFLRDAAPRIYAHPADTTMNLRGPLGHVTGVVEEGECVVADAVRYYDVAPIPDRKFIHVWAHVRAAAEPSCDARAQSYVPLKYHAPRSLTIRQSAPSSRSTS